MTEFKRMLLLLLLCVRSECLWDDSLFCFSLIHTRSQKIVIKRKEEWNKHGLFLRGNRASSVSGSVARSIDLLGFQQGMLRAFLVPVDRFSLSLLNLLVVLQHHVDRVIDVLQSILRRAATHLCCFSCCYYCGWNELLLLCFLFVALPAKSRSKWHLTYFTPVVVVTSIDWIDVIVVRQANEENEVDRLIGLSCVETM